MRAQAWAEIKKEQPTLLIGSPMCTAFSAWQYISNTKRDAKVVAEEKARGLRLLSLCCELNEYQASKGCYLMHERPSQATSWCTEVVKRIILRVSTAPWGITASMGLSTPASRSRSPLDSSPLKVRRVMLGACTTN